jgi:hypothetical protein
MVDNFSNSMKLESSEHLFMCFVDLADTRACRADVWPKTLGVGLFFFYI